jgi:hypothetical protein
MRTSASRARFNPRAVGVALSGMLIAGLAVLAGPTMANAQSSGMAMASSPNIVRVGTTRGWLNGRVVTFSYSKAFECKEPPSAATRSHCEVGAEYNAIPAPTFDPLYVVVPIGFTPRRSTLQCPHAGRCVDHPHRIDLSRVFGNGSGHSLLPPHSHVVTTRAGGTREYWNVVVIGITSRHTWQRVVAGKSYQTIQRMRAAGNPHVTSNIPSNLFLFFSVK